MEAKLLQNVPFNWKKAQKNNTGMDNWLFKVFTEEEVLKKTKQ